VNLCVLLDMAADAFPDRTVVGRRNDGLTAGQLRDVSFAGARMIRDASADAVVYLGINGPEFPAALFSAARAGVPLVPINYRLGDEQLAALVARHPRALFLVDEVALERLEAGSVSARLLGDWFAEARAEMPGEIDEPEAGDVPAVVIYTSGTTAEPKGVLIRHSHLMSYVFGSVEFGCADASDAALISLPPYHIAAVANAITNIYAGRRTVVLEQFTPEGWLSTVQQEEITNALIVPTMLSRIVGSAVSDEQVVSLRSLAYGGAPMPAHVISRALQLWPNVEFVNAYGLTETSSTIAVLGPEDHRAALSSDDPRIRARLGSAGRILPSVEVQIRDPFAGSVLPVGSTGRIWVRGDQVSAEYAGLGKATDAEGWFDTRDEGRLDEDGFLFIGGRTDDTIIRGGENIAPAEIEDVLVAHECVDEAVIVGVPDPEWGQRLEAAVVLRPDCLVTAGELREHVRSRLRGSKTPDRIVVWEELPRTDTGKILRRTVLERLTTESAPITT
jgi:acyl-CoA synthetase (AMP-forming)/AMP-acid ligase II